MWRFPILWPCFWGFIGSLILVSRIIAYSKDEVVILKLWTDIFSTNGCIHAIRISNVLCRYGKEPLEVRLPMMFVRGRLLQSVADLVSSISRMLVLSGSPARFPGMIVVSTHFSPLLQPIHSHMKNSSRRTLIWMMLQFVANLLVEIRVEYWIAWHFQEVASILSPHEICLELFILHRIVYDKSPLPRDKWETCKR